MLHKTQTCAPFDPKCWYIVRKINKDNLPYVFSVVFCDFNAFSVAWNWHPRLKTTENATKTQNTTLKIYGKLSRFTFLTLYQHLGSKSALFCVLWSIFTDRVCALRNTVNVWDHMSRLTSCYLEQFEWSACGTNDTNEVRFYIKRSSKFAHQQRGNIKIQEKEKLNQ